MADIKMSDPGNTVPKPFVFVLMPFDSKFDDIYKFGIKGAADDVGAYAERVDEQIFMEGILDRIFNQISKADVIVADMTGRNPNVFYEVGYAHALGKIVILLTQNSDDIPFDLKHRQHTVYAGKIEGLRIELATKLEWAIRETKNRTDSKLIERISLSIMHKVLPQGFEKEDLPVLKGITPSEIFSVPVLLRNDGLEVFQGASHVYLFASRDCTVVPGKETPDLTAVWSTTAYAQGDPIESARKLVASDPFDANPMDAPDGLTTQFQLPITFSALPPGAIDRQYMSLMFKEGQNHCDSIYRLRLHSKTRYYDYPFRLVVEYEDKKKKEKV
jgi:hypothetical protein